MFIGRSFLKLNCHSVLTKIKDLGNDETAQLTLLNSFCEEVYNKAREDEQFKNKHGKETIFAAK